MNIELPVIEKGINDISVISPGSWYYPQTTWTNPANTVNFSSLEYRWEVYNKINDQWELLTSHIAPSGSYTVVLSSANVYSINSGDVGKFIRFGLRATFQKIVSEYVYSNCVFVDKYFNEFNSPEDIYDDVELWLDGLDSATMFVDVSGTMPVVQTGDRVGCWKDKSKYKRHAFQSTQSKKPYFFFNSKTNTSGILNTTYKSNIEIRTNDLLDSLNCKTIICGMEIISNGTSQGAGITPVLLGSLTNAYGCRNSGCQGFGAPQDVYYNTNSHIWAFSTTEKLIYCEYLSYETQSVKCYFLDQVYEEQITPSPYQESFGGTPFVVAWSYRNANSSLFCKSSKSSTNFVFNTSVNNSNYNISRTGYLRLFSGGPYVTNTQGIYKSSAGGSFVGTIREILILNKALTPNDYLLVYEYLKTKWN